MIKVIYCLRRKAGMSIEEFQKYWLGTHAAFGKNIEGVKRYVQAHALGGELQEMLAEGHPAGKNEPFDGVAELWFDEADLRELSGKPGGLAALMDEANFIDFDRSVIFLAKEHVIVEK
ncbi:EthD domain-containing protein [Candidatus Poribacteria bacterium]|nr:EthD domain-containing protein [Candidatus Poribacteria bacterium]